MCLPRGTPQVAVVWAVPMETRLLRRCAFRVVGNRVHGPSSFTLTGEADGL